MRRNDPDAAFAFNPRRKFLILIPFAIILVCIVLANVIDFSHYPEKALDGAAWDRSWEMLGTVLGVETDPAGMTLDTNATILTGDDVAYATWVTGEERTVTGESGDEVTVHQAQVYLLLYGCGDADYARSNMNDFIARERETYDILAETEADVNGVTWQVMTYRVKSETNPYDRGAVAFTVFKNYVVSAELTCLADYPEDAAAQLSAFLAQVHFTAE